MSIYATLWWLQFPRYGDEYIGCEWIRVTAQGVPAHVGTPTPGFGYEDGDPYAEFLPSAVEVNPNGDSEFMRAVVIITEETKKVPLVPGKSTRIHYSSFPVGSTPPSHLSTCTHVSATLYAGQGQKLWGNRSHPTAKFS